jgi:sec-independent protein translocase protein TatC
VAKLIQISQPVTTLQGHLRELALRIGVSLVVMTIAGIAVYAFVDPILTLLRSPLNAPLYYNNPAGSFALILKICFMGALTISIPVLIYNLIMFVRPAFEQSISKKLVYITSATSSILAIIGAVFAFTIILPGSLNFFAGFRVSGLDALISADSYLGFVTNIIITFVIMFQLPLLITFIDTLKPLPPKKLLKFEKWVVLGSLIIALIAPFTYDFLTSLLIAAPIIALYNLSILIVVIKHAQIERKAFIPIIYENTANPAATFDLILSEIALENMADELVNFGKPEPLTVAQSKRTCMDMMSKQMKPATVQPAAWFQERQSKRAALNANVQVFSDIRRNPRTSRVLA